MAKIEEVIKRASSKKLSPLQRKVLKELEKRSDEVFTYRDPAFVVLFPDANPNGINWSLSALHDKGLIGKFKIKGDRTYFGSQGAINALKERLDSARGNRGKKGKA